MNDKIILKNVTKQIKGQEVLSRVNLELDAGGIYGFFGRNGSGKTMLLRAIAGLIRVNGKIIVFGKDLSRFFNLYLQVRYRLPWWLRQ